MECRGYCSKWAIWYMKNWCTIMRRVIDPDIWKSCEVSGVEMISIPKTFTWYPLILLPPGVGLLVMEHHLQNRIQPIPMRQRGHMMSPVLSVTGWLSVWVVVRSLELRRKGELVPDFCGQSSGTDTVVPPEDIIYIRYCRGWLPNRLFRNILFYLCVLAHRSDFI